LLFSSVSFKERLRKSRRNLPPFIGVFLYCRLLVSDYNRVNLKRKPFHWKKLYFYPIFLKEAHLVKNFEFFSFPAGFFLFVFV